MQSIAQLVSIAEGACERPQTGQMDRTLREMAGRQQVFEEAMKPYKPLIRAHHR